MSPVIVVQKSGENIRLYVDMRQANTAIIRERHPIPIVDKIQYNVIGSDIFSKLDLKSGYRPIELDESSPEINFFYSRRSV